MADLHIVAFGANWDEVEDFDEDLDDDSRNGVWALVRDQDWTTLTAWLRAQGVLEPDERVRKARLLREALSGGDRDRLWIRITRPS